MAPTCLALERAKELRVPPPKGKPHSVALPGTAREGRSAVYRHWRFTDELLKTLDPEVRTMHEAFEQAAKRVPRNKCLGHRPYDPNSQTWGNYVWEDYETVHRRKTNFGAGLVQLHQKVSVTASKYGVGIWCQNRPEWQIADLACMSQGLFSVSIYDSLGPDTTEYIVNHAELNCVVTSLDHIPTLLKLKPRLPSLKLIVSLDPLSAGELRGHSKAELLNAISQDLGVAIHYIRDIEAMGEQNPLPPNPPSPDDLITINYTSGTTGNPKGVVLTHANAIAAASTSLLIIKQAQNDRVCSFLPLAHIYERVGEHGAMWAGAAIGYFHGVVTGLIDDLKLIRPTAFSGVPRLFNRFGSAIKEATVKQPGVRGALSRHVAQAKLAALKDKSNPSNAHVLYDRIWSRKVAANLGLDQCLTMVSGSAPLDPSLHQFLRVVFSNHFIQGYGLTETYAVSLAQLEGDFSAGNCGAVAATTEVCLADVPDMEYLSTDKPFPRGELLIRSTTQFREYHRSPEETTKAIDPDGWFRTGDICTVDELGRFRIIDRVKNVLKLAQGEYISPERIENVYLANCGWLATAYVHGDSHQSCLVGIFGVAPEQFATWAGKVLKKKVDSTDLKAMEEDVCHDPKIRAAALKELEKVGKRNKFNSYERIRAVRLFVEPFTIENELLTPTLKLKRPQTAKRYRQHLDELYEEAIAEIESQLKANL